MIAGGYKNAIMPNAETSCVSGGRENVIVAPENSASDNAAIGGGLTNTVMGSCSVVAGGMLNTASEHFAIAGGGRLNVITARYGVVGGGLSNSVSGTGGSVTGGASNVVSGYASHIGGGSDNDVGGDYAVVSGGIFNSAQGLGAVIGGGYNNFAAGDNSSAVAGGTDNIASGEASSVSGGQYNTAGGTHAAVLGGSYNTATGVHSVIVGGTMHVVKANMSTAIGVNTMVQHDNALAVGLLGTAEDATCLTVAANSAHFCADNGVFVNGDAVVTQSVLDSVNATAEAGLAAAEANSATLVLHDLWGTRIEADIDDVHDNLTSVWTSMRSLAEATAATKKDLNSLDSRVTNLVDSGITRLEASVNSTEDNLTVVWTTLAEQGDALSVAQDEIKTLAADVGGLRNDVSSVDASVQSLESDVDAVQATVDALASNQSRMDSELALCSCETQDELRAQVDSLETQVAELSANFTALAAVVADLAVTTSFASPSTNVDTTGAAVVSSAASTTGDSIDDATTLCPECIPAENKTTMTSAELTESTMTAASASATSTSDSLLQSPTDSPVSSSTMDTTGFTSITTTTASASATSTSDSLLQSPTDSPVSSSTSSAATADATTTASVIPSSTSESLIQNPTDSPTTSSPTIALGVDALQVNVMCSPSSDYVCHTVFSASNTSADTETANDASNSYEALVLVPWSGVVNISVTLSPEAVNLLESDHSADGHGFILRVELVAVDSSGVPLSTNPLPWIIHEADNDSMLQTGHVAVSVSAKNFLQVDDDLDEAARTYVVVTHLLRGSSQASPIATATSTELFFVRPPVVRSVWADQLSSSTAVWNTFMVHANVTAPSWPPRIVSMGVPAAEMALQTTFRVVDLQNPLYVHAVVDDTNREVTLAATRPYILEVAVLDAFGETSTCRNVAAEDATSFATTMAAAQADDSAAACFELPWGTGDSPASDVLDDVLGFFLSNMSATANSSTGEDLATAAFVAGLDAVAGSLSGNGSSSFVDGNTSSAAEVAAQFEELLDAFVTQTSIESDGGTAAEESTAVAQTVSVLAMFVDTAIGAGTDGGSVGSDLLGVLSDIGDWMDWDSGGDTQGNDGSDSAADPEEVLHNAAEVYLSTLDAYVSAAPFWGSDGSNSTESSGDDRAHNDTSLVSVVPEFDKAAAATCPALLGDGSTSSSTEASTFSLVCSSSSSSDSDDSNGDDDSSSNSSSLVTATVVSTNTATVVVPAPSPAESDSNKNASSNTTETEVYTVSVTTWSTANSSAAVAQLADSSSSSSASLMSDIYGVHVTDSDGASASAEVDGSTEESAGYTVEIQLSASATDTTTAAESLRARVSCRYFDEGEGVWSERGVVLRGLRVESAPTVSTSAPLEVSAVCVSSHLTLFTVEDDSAVLVVVESKLSALAARVETIGSTDVLDGNAEVNWPVLGMFLGISAATGIVVAVLKIHGRHHSVEIGRQVFVRQGYLERAQVVGPVQFEAILLGRASASEIARLAALSIATGNAFVGVLFSWAHESMVFSRADKAIDAYTAVVMTFLSSAFFFETATSSSEGTVGAGGNASSGVDGGDEDASAVQSGLLGVFVSAAVANLLFLPIQYILAYMITNVNTMRTSTHVPTGLVTMQWRRLKRKWCSCSRAQKLRRRSSRRAKQIVPIGDARDDNTSATKVAQKVKIVHTTSGRRRAPESVRREQAARVTRVFLDAAVVAKLRMHNSKHDGSNDALEDDLESQSEGLRLHGQSVQHERVPRISTTLQFLSCDVHVPLHGTSVLREKHVAGSESKDGKSCHLPPELEPALRRFQRHVQELLGNRSDLRTMEFTTWHQDMRGPRTVLVWLSLGVVAVVVLSTLLVCVTLSAAFTWEECVLWAEDVGFSILVQVFVTSPAVSISQLIIKSLGSLVLLRAARRQQRRVEIARLRATAARNDDSLRRSDALLHAELSRLRAAKIALSGDPDALADERAKEQQNTARLEAQLNQLREQRKVRAQTTELKQQHVEASDAETEELVVATTIALRAAQVCVECIVGPLGAVLPVDGMLRDLSSSVCFVHVSVSVCLFACLPVCVCCALLLYVHVHVHRTRWQS